MILAIDIENTDIVLGGILDGSIRFTARIGTDHVKTQDQYAVEMKSVLALYGVDPGEIQGCIIASVVPPVLSEVRAAVVRLTGKTPLIVGPGIKTGLNIRIENPTGMGSDMIAISVAGLKEYRPPLIIFDMNAVTSVSVLDAGGNYVGGCLCPGIRISLDAMCERTAQLPRVSLDPPRRVIGRNTVECMRSGAMYGNASMLDGLSRRIEEELGTPAAVLATGKLAAAVCPLCQRKIIYDEQLLMKGLQLLYEKNCPAK